MPDIQLFPFDLSDIDDSNKWNYIRAGIEIAVTQGITMSDTADILRDIGLSFANDPFRDLYREISDYRADFEYVTRLSQFAKPNPDLMAIGKFPISAEYGYVFGVWESDPKTGEIFLRTFRADTDMLLSRQQVDFLMRNHILIHEAEMDLMIDEPIYLGAFRNPE